LASALAPIGAVVMLATLAALYWARGVSAWNAFALLPVAAACVWLIMGIHRLSRQVACAPLDDGIARVKAAAKNVPAWVTVVAWSSLAAVVVLFLAAAHVL
jgi:hypothetical protein